MSNGSSLAAGAIQQPSLSMFGTVGVPITIVAAVGVVLIGILAVRSRQKKKARAAAAARLAAAQTVQVSMAELRDSERPRTSVESSVRRTPPATETRKVSPARRFAEPRAEARSEPAAWPSTGEWRAVTAQPQVNGANGADSQRIAARLNGAAPARDGSATRVNGAPAERNGTPTRVNGTATTRANGTGATRVNGTSLPVNGTPRRDPATPRNGAAPPNGAQRSEVVPQRNGAPAQPTGEQRTGQRIPRPATVPQRGPRPTNGHEVAQDPGWPAEPDWPS
jgi:hypothetical protein